ncbi:MAG: hypothetical protein AUJ54_10710 [Ignavibacteria bacterium CG1_02_37_35]|nr:MAG: hypothetical protein AUJ54_10710 [Ignavibacteria bacterium CG1_02_37_35]
MTDKFFGYMSLDRMSVSTSVKLALPNLDKPEPNCSWSAVNSMQVGMIFMNQFLFLFITPSGLYLCKKFKSAIKNSVGVQCFFESMQQFNKTTSITVI